MSHTGRKSQRSKHTRKYHSAALPKGAVGLQVVGRLIGGALPLVVVGRVDLPALRDGEAGVVPGWGQTRGRV